MHVLAASSLSHALNKVTYEGKRGPSPHITAILGLNPNSRIEKDINGALFDMKKSSLLSAKNYQKLRSTGAHNPQHFMAQQKSTRMGFLYGQCCLYREVVITILINSSRQFLIKCLLLTLRRQRSMHGEN